MASVDPQPAGRAGAGAADLPYRGAGQDGHAVAFQLGADEGAELRVDGGQYLGELLDLGDGQAAGGQGLGHLQADVAGADDHRADSGLVSSRVRMTAKVSSIECSRCTPSAGPSTSSPAIGGRTGTAPVPMTSWS